MNTARENSNLAAMTDIEPVIAGRRLQPFSAGRLQLCRQAGVRLVTGGAANLSQDDVEKELVAFFFIHTFPLDLVRDACAKTTEMFYTEHIEPLLFDFPARELPKLMAFIEREFGSVESANVEVIPKPGHGATDSAPPNI